MDKSAVLEAPVKFSNKGLVILDREIMYFAEHPIQERMAELSCKGSLNILELGYGLGYSATRIDELKPNANHIIVEANKQIFNNATRKFPDKKIILGFWEDLYSMFEYDYFDSILYDTYPFQELNKIKDVNQILQWVTPVLQKLRIYLKIGGRLVFLDITSKLDKSQLTCIFPSYRFNSYEMTLNLDYPTVQIIECSRIS